MLLQGIKTTLDGLGLLSLQCDHLTAVITDPLAHVMDLTLLSVRGSLDIIIEAGKGMIFSFPLVNPGVQGVEGIIEAVIRCD